MAGGRAAAGGVLAPLNPRLPAELLARWLPTLDLAFGYSCEKTAWPSGIMPLDVDLSLLSPARAPVDVDALASPVTLWDAQRLALAVREGRLLEQVLMGYSHASLVSTQLWRLLGGSVVGVATD